ncbi:MAG: putative toxin-antitoxin system toxin component, PIN family, partial [Candidatus Woesearchaeota archaeon]
GYPYNAVIEGIKGSYQLLLSLEILDELRDKLLYKLGFPAAQTDEYITLLSRCAVTVHPESTFSVAVDPKDNKIFDCAVSGNAKYIVSGDSHVIKVGTFKGIKVLSAAEFVKLLSSS